MSHRAARYIIGSSVGGGAAYIIYDYKTCHPFRKMRGYDVEGAWIRFHNQFRPKHTLQVISLKELDKFHGQDGGPTYFSSDGMIWDVSNSESFQKAYGLFRGKDGSVCLAKMSMDQQHINRTDWDTLSEKEWESLHSWTRYFEQKYFIKGRLKEFEL